MGGDNARLFAAVGHEAEEPPPLQLLALLERVLSTTGWFWKTNAEGCTTFVSSSYAAVSGMQPGEVLGRNEWTQGRNLKAAMARRLATAAGQRAEFSEIEYQQMRGDALEPIWCIASGVPVWDAQGTFRGYWGVTRVITERKRVEQRLQASEARYRQLANTVSDWIWSTNERHEISELSVAPRISKAHTLGRCRWDFTDAQLPENDWPTHRATLDSRLPFRDFEFVRQDDSGTKRWVSISGAPRFDGAGVFLGYQGTGRHITERKLAELQLARSEARYRRLATLSVDWEWGSDAQHRFTFFSERAINLSLNSPGQGLGRTRWELEGVFPEQPEWDEHRRQLTAREPIRDFEYPRASVVPPRVRWTMVSGDPVFAADGSFLGYEGTARDVTTKKQAQLRLQYLTRMYAALSDVERDVSALDDVEEAIAAVCRLTYDVGGLARVIFFARDAQAAELVVTHYAGSDSPAITRLNLSERQDNQDASLPIVLAAIERRAQLSQDYCGDPRVARFHDLARRRGINASLALPVCIQSRLVGVLGLYAREPDWFDDELVVLSERIVASLTQAIDAIENRSAKRTAEAELARSEARYRQFAALASDWHWESDREHRFTYMSGNLSVHREQQLGERIGQVICSPPCTPEPGQLARYRLLLDAHEPIRDLLLHITGLPLQPWWRVNAAPRFDARDTFLGYSGTTRDVTPEITAELARRQAEDQFNRLARLSVDWYWQTDAEGRISHVSESYTRMTGIPLSDVQGLLAFQPGPTDGSGDQRAQGEREIAALVAARQPFYDKVYLRSQKVSPGQEEWRITSGEPVFDADGVFLGYRGTARAISTPGRSEDEEQR